MTLLPAAARLLPVVLPEGSIMVELPGSITEFLRVWSFFACTPLLLLFISDISPTLGNALEFLYEKIIKGANAHMRAPNFMSAKDRTKNMSICR